MSAEPRPRFLLIAGYPDSIVRYRGRLLSRIQAAGMEIHVASPQIATHPDKPQLEAMGAIVHELPLDRTGMSLTSDLKLFLALLSLARRVRPTTVLTYTNKPILYGIPAAWMAGVRARYALLPGLGFAFEAENFNHPLKRVMRLMYRAMMPLVTRVFFQNPDDEAQMRELGILGKTPSVVVSGSGVDVSEFQVAPLPGTPAFVLITRLIKEKGVREYIAAATEIKRRHPQVRFTILGKSDDRPNAIQPEELQAHVAAGVIEYPGHVADVRPYIAGSSALVMPSWYREGVPRSNLEALSMGRAVITCDSPGCRETVIDGVNGYLVPPRSVEALVDAMEKLVTSPERVRAMGRESRLLAERRFDVHAVNRAMLTAMAIPLGPDPAPVAALDGSRA